MRTTEALASALLGFFALTASSFAGQALQPVNIATSAAGQSGYLAALIENRGLDAKYGIKITNMMMGFTEAANAVKLGRTLASSMQPSTAVNLVKSGTDIRLITPQIWSGNAWVVRKDAPYKSFADLKGKKIGNFARVTGAYFFSAVIAKENKLDIEKDFQNVPAETGALIALLERGEVEAINMFEPHTTRLVLSGKYRVLLDFDVELGESSAHRRLNPTVGHAEGNRGKATGPGQGDSQRLHGRSAADQKRSGRRLFQGQSQGVFQSEPAGRDLRGHQGQQS